MCTGSSAALIKSLPTYYGWLGGNRIRSADISGWFLEANLGQWAISEERDRVRGQSRERERERERGMHGKARPIGKLAGREK